MTLDPLLAAPLVVQVHAFAAMAAFVLGIVQLAGPKGTLPHRTLGYIWVGLMLVVAASSFAIQGMRQLGRLQRHPSAVGHGGGAGAAGGAGRAPQAHVDT